MTIDFCKKSGFVVFIVSESGKQNFTACQDEADVI